MQGMMGVASRSRKHLRSETPELLTVIASLIGGALNKAHLFQRALAREKQTRMSKQETDIEAKKVNRELMGPTDETEADSSLVLDQHAVNCVDDSFKNHIRKMKMFRASHS
jgi:hypothetical protein